MPASYYTNRAIWIRKQPEIAEAVSVRKKDRPTAVVCDSDYHALELFQAAYQLNIKVPDELSIIGFGGLSPAKYSAVPLTTVEQPFEQIGFEAARMLLEHITTQK